MISPHALNLRSWARRPFCGSAEHCIITQHRSFCSRPVSEKEAFFTSKKEEAEQSHAGASELVEYLLETDRHNQLSTLSTTRSMHLAAPQDRHHGSTETQDLNLLEQPWFFDLSRDDANTRLKGSREGTYLLRRSRSNLNDYALSVRLAGRTRHYRIMQREDDTDTPFALMLIDRDCLFNSLEELVHRCTSDRLLTMKGDVAVGCLTKPLPKEGSVQTLEILNEKM
ncbi:tyrosine-protein kinase [Planoprotostelium fungivorum]|uniref:Tyrosine-protein kinase n=1 Tax=Planoprotostelium fungivorum TaxID=1890364 RepID=A0A2P6NW49_9EUKA|nr:tyrosine-protein kinase [Planoprotostelium fungivorum]